MTKTFEDEYQFTRAIRLRLEGEAMMDVDTSEYVIGAPGRMAVMPFNPGSYWAAIQRTNGEVHRFNFDLKDDPDEDHQLFLMEILRGLNKEVGHGGRWVVAWTHGNTRFILMWMDEDGDVQFTVENDEAWLVMATQERLHWLGQAEAGWQHWHHSMRVLLDPGADALYKLAQGQKAPGGLAWDPDKLN